MEKRTGLPQGKAEKGYCTLEDRTVRGICTQAMRSGEGERKRRERRVKRGATDQEVKRGTRSQESMQTNGGKVDSFPKCKMGRWLGCAPLF